jgi:hypothetical protein
VRSQPISIPIIRLRHNLHLNRPRRRGGPRRKLPRVWTHRSLGFPFIPITKILSIHPLADTNDGNSPVGRPAHFNDEDKKWLLEQARARNWDPTKADKGVSRAFYAAVIADWVEIKGFSAYTGKTEDEVQNTLGKTLSSLSPERKKSVIKHRGKAKKILREVYHAPSSDFNCLWALYSLRNSLTGTAIC